MAVISGDPWYQYWTKDDRLYGTTQSDLMRGYEGNDTLTGDFGNDNLYGGNGNDSLVGGFDNDFLYGESGNDILRGQQGSDYLNGGSGNDVLDGFWYNKGGNGEKDTLRGGEGSDTFIIGDWYGKGYEGTRDWAVIEDFSQSEGDKIKVQGSLSQYQLRSGDRYGYSSNDTAIVLSSNPSEVFAVALRVSSSKGSIQLSTRDFIAT